MIFTRKFIVFTLFWKNVPILTFGLFSIKMEDSAERLVLKMRYSWGTWGRYTLVSRLELKFLERNVSFFSAFLLLLIEFVFRHWFFFKRNPGLRWAIDLNERDSDHTLLIEKWIPIELTRVNILRAANKTKKFQKNSRGTANSFSEVMLLVICRYRLASGVKQTRFPRISDYQCVPTSLAYEPQITEKDIRPEEDRIFEIRTIRWKLSGWHKLLFLNITYHKRVDVGATAKYRVSLATTDNSNDCELFLDFDTNDVVFYTILNVKLKKQKKKRTSR